MRISVNWLNDWLGRPEEARDLAARLTMAGLEVEAVEPAAGVTKADFDVDKVVAKVVQGVLDEIDPADPPADQDPTP